MTKIDIDTQRTRLENLKDTLTNDLSTIAIFDPKTGDWEARFDFEEIDESDENLTSDTNELADGNVATLALLETRYRNVVRALDKIAAGTYGICEVGEEEIEVERLLANPAARTCKKHMNDEEDLPL